MVDTSKGSPDRFGYTWDRFATLTPEQELQFEYWTKPITSVDGWRGKSFIDAGCGTGRNAYGAMKHGATGGVVSDLDDRTLERARQNLAPFPTVAVRHESIYDLPYENEFDIAISIGVLQHLEHPKLAVKQLAKVAKPGGRVLIWVYGYENLEFYANVVSPVRNALFSRMPLGLVRFLALIPTAVLWLMLKLGFRPFEYLRVLSTFPFRHVHHIVFGQMLPKTVHYFTKQQVLELFEGSGLRDVEAHWVNQCSWTVTGIKP